MRCSVVIPCHGGVELTRACLASLLEQRGVEELEVLLVDNASSDGTAELATMSPVIRVLRQEQNLGFAGGVNVGLRAARLPFVLVLNNDTQAAENMLQELHRVLTSDAAIGAVAPMSNFVKGPAQLPVSGTGAASVRAEVRDALADEPCEVQDVDTLAGLCLMLRRETLAEVGEFDERFGNGNFEDDDFCLRLRVLGHRLVIARRAFLHHEGHATFKALGLDLASELQQRLAQFASKWEHDPAGQAVLAQIRGDHAGAAAASANARRVWPDWPDGDWYLGRFHNECGDHVRAIEHLDRLLHRCPRHSDAALELAIARLAGGDEAGAGAQLQWASTHCALAPDALANTLCRIGEHLYGKGRTAAAAESFRDALALDPGSGELHNWLGSCLLAEGKLDAATESFRTAIEHDHALAHTNLAICEMHAGHHERAAELFERACVLLPEHPVPRQNLAAFRQQHPAAV